MICRPGSGTPLFFMDITFRFNLSKPKVKLRKEFFKQEAFGLTYIQDASVLTNGVPKYFLFLLKIK